jgi:hypothetical protein
MAFVMSYPLQPLLLFWDWCLTSSRFLLVWSHLVFLRLAACSSISVCHCLVYWSRIVLLHLAAWSDVSVCRFVVLQSQSVFLHLAHSSWILVQCFAFLESLSFSPWVFFFPCDLIRRWFCFFSAAGLVEFLSPTNHWTFSVSASSSSSTFLVTLWPSLLKNFISCGKDPIANPFAMANFGGVYLDAICGCIPV